MKAKRYFVELDPDTDRPRKVAGLYAVQCDSNEVSTHRTIKEAQAEADRRNQAEGRA